MFTLLTTRSFFVHGPAHSHTYSWLQSVVILNGVFIICKSGNNDTKNTGVYCNVNI